MCQTKSGWKCPYLSAMDYKVLLDKEGKIIKSAFASDDINKNDIKEGFNVEERRYEGCPALEVKKQKDAFDF